MYSIDTQTRKKVQKIKKKKTKTCRPISFMNIDREILNRALTYMNPAIYKKNIP